MTEPKQLVLIFPCQFPIKVMGRTGQTFEDAVFTIFSKHISNFDRRMMQIRPSKEKRFSAITVAIEAQNCEQLDAIYRDLTDNKHILMAL